MHKIQHSPPATLRKAVATANPAIPPPTMTVPSACVAAFDFMLNAVVENWRDRDDERDTAAVLLLEMNAVARRRGGNLM